MSLKALESHLACLQPYLTEENITDIYINKSYEMVVEKVREITFHYIHELSYSYLETLACLIAESSHQFLSSKHPLLSATLPSGERVQCVLPPACEKGKILFAIRRHRKNHFLLQDYLLAGSFKAFSKKAIQKYSPESKKLADKITGNETRRLIQHYEKGDITSFISDAVLYRKNILISAGTGIGKTTFLNACVNEIPLNERIITLEDTREVIIPHGNSAHLLVSKGHQSVANISMQDLFECCLRLKPDRILLAELRGSEAFSYLRAINSGHPGSLTTLHANSPNEAFKQILLMLQQANLHLSERELNHYIRSSIPIVIQLKRSASPDIFVEVADIYYDALKDC